MKLYSYFRSSASYRLHRCRARATTVRSTVRLKATKTFVFD